MIRFEDLTTECFKSLSLEIVQGKTYKILTHSDHDTKVFLDTILTLRAPTGGDVYLFGKQVNELMPSELETLFRRLGVVWARGGLISNLKVRENITLPLWYHKAVKPTDMEDRIIEFFNLADVNVSNLPEFMGKLPGPLRLFEKRLVALGRVYVTQPELLLYDSLLEGIDYRLAKKFLKIAQKLQSEDSGRTSVFVSSDEDSLQGLNADITIRQEGYEFTVCQ